MSKRVAFSGISNSGKTTLIEKIANKLNGLNKKILIIKHDSKDKATFDIKGKDSYRFFQTGADVIVSSATRTTHFSHKENQIEEILKNIDKDLDYVFIEGFKGFDMLRITVARETLHPDYFGNTNAFAIDDTIDKNDIVNEEILDLNNVDSIIEWINEHA